MVSLWCALFVFGIAGVACEEGVMVEVSVLVASDYNESNLYSNLLHPNVSRKVFNSSNITGNVSTILNASNSSLQPPVVIIFSSNSFVRLIGVAPVLCVIGFDYNCFNDTNVTRVMDIIAPTNGSLPVGYIVGICATVLVLVVVLSIWSCHKFKRKPPEKPEKRLVIPITIDWPPKDLNKKLNLGNGVLQPMPFHQPLPYHHA